MLNEQDYFVDVSKGLGSATAKDRLRPTDIESQLLRFYKNDVDLYKEVMYFIGLLYVMKEVQEKDPSSGFEGTLEIYKEIFKFSLKNLKLPELTDDAILDIFENNDFFVENPYSSILRSANDKLRNSNVGQELDSAIRNKANRTAIQFFSYSMKEPEFIKQFTKRYGKYVSSIPKISNEMLNLIKVAVFLSNSETPNISNLYNLSREYILKNIDDSRVRELATFAMKNDPVNLTYNQELSQRKFFEKEIDKNIINKFSSDKLNETISEMFMVNKDRDRDGGIRILLKDIRSVLLPVKKILVSLKVAIDKTAPIYLKGSSEEILQEIYRDANMYYQQNVARQPEIDFEAFADPSTDSFGRLKFAISQVTEESLKEPESNSLQELNKNNKKVYVLDLDKLKSNSLNESWLRMFGSWIETILSKMFSGSSIPVNVRGSRKDVESFGKAFYGEKRYLQLAKKYGLDHPKTYASKSTLEKAVNGFEKETGLKWPFN